MDIHLTNFKKSLKIESETKVLRNGEEMGTKKYSLEEIEALEKNPNVLEVVENRLPMTLELRQQVYEAWSLNPVKSTVKRMMEIHGFDTQKIGANYAATMARVFQKGGRQRFTKASAQSQENWEKKEYIPTKTAEELFETGKFVWDMNRFVLHPDFETELYKNYPQQTIEEGLLKNEVLPKDFGYHKIFSIKEKFEDSLNKDCVRAVKRGRREGFSSLITTKYQSHPYVESATREILWSKMRKNR